MILLLDNYDSFVFNLGRYLEQLGEEVEVLRNDEATVSEALAASPTHIVVSPGPCTPAEAGIATELVRASSGTPVLGVCLGHQCVGSAFGGHIVRAGRPQHGMVSSIHHDGTDLFSGLPSPLAGTRYHSLVVDAATLPPCLRPLAWADDGALMALRHDRLPIWGVQFHPEAVLTEHGHALLANFLALGREMEPLGVSAHVPPPELEPGSVRPPAARGPVTDLAAVPKPFREA